MNRLARLRTLVVGIAVAALVATGCEWHFETLDGGGGPNGRINSDVGYDNAAVLYNGRPHIFYYDNDSGDLRHGYYNGSFWAFEILDGEGGPNGRINADVGMEATAMLYNGRPHVFYYDFDSEDLRHGYYNGSFWAFEILDGEGGPNGRTIRDVGTEATTLLYGGRPHVFYYDFNSEDLRHGYYNGQYWAFEILDGEGGPNGRTIRDVGMDATTLLYGGRPHVFYYDFDSGDLRHGYYNGQYWAFEILDGHQNGPNGRINANVGMDATTLLYGGRPHVFYYAGGGGDLRHGYYNGQYWAFEILDGEGGPNGRVNTDVGAEAAAMLYGGRPQVFYYDGTDGDLRRAHYNGSTWMFETLDGAGGANGRVNKDVGESNAVLLYNGGPHVFYHNADEGNLRHGWFG